MDIPDESPRVDKPKTGKLPITEGDIIIASLAGELVASQGQISALSYMRARHLESEERRSPMSGPKKSEKSTATPEGIEAFLISDHASHLSRIVGLEDQLAKSRRSVEIIDETDFSGRSLYDFIPEDVKTDLHNQLTSLKTRASIQTSVEGELGAFCGEIWDDYRSGKEKTTKERKKLTEVLLLGPDASPKDRKDLQHCSKELGEVETMGELVGLEKVRLVVRALTAGPKDYDEKAADAERILGPEFSLIKAQVAHMEATLEMDWSKAADGEVILNPTGGKDLVCDAVKSKMERIPDKDGNPTEDRKIGDDQVKTLESAYIDAAARKEDSEGPRDRSNRKISFILAATEMLEIGKKARMANILKTVRELDNPEFEIGDESSPERKKLSQWLREKGSMGLKTLVRLPKKGVVAAIKAAPQAIVLGIASKMWQQNLDLDGKHFGSQEQFTVFMKESIGEFNHVT